MVVEPCLPLSASQQDSSPVLPPLSNRYQNVWMYVIHEMENAVGACNNGGETRPTAPPYPLEDGKATDSEVESPNRKSHFAPRRIPCREMSLLSLSRRVDTRLACLAHPTLHIPPSHPATPSYSPWRISYRIGIAQTWALLTEALTTGTKPGLSTPALSRARRAPAM